MNRLLIFIFICVNPANKTAGRHNQSVISAPASLHTVGMQAGSISLRIDRFNLRKS